MSNEWWGYISIDADTIPERLSNKRPPFLDRAWVIWETKKGYWIPWECEPSAEVRGAFQDAKENGEIDEYQIIHPMPV